MNASEISTRINPAELRYATSSSSGPGGQNVNKVNTKVELRFNIQTTVSFSAEEKVLIYSSLNNRITNDGDLLIISQSERTQLQNKKKAEESLYRLLAKALKVNPERRATRPTASSKAKRIDEKKRRGQIKSLRKDLPE